MIEENASVINLHFVHVFIKLTLPRSLLYRLQRQTIRAFNRLSPKNVGSFMRVSTVFYKIDGKVFYNYKEKLYIPTKKTTINDPAELLPLRPRIRKLL